MSDRFDATESTTFIPAEAVRSVLQWNDMVEVIRAAYSGELQARSLPPRSVARGDRTWFRSLTAAPSGTRFMGAKIFGMSRDKSVTYLIALMDQERGGFTALVDASYVTSFRTGATSAVAVDRLAPKGASRLAVLGSGGEADAHIRAIAAVRQLSEVRIYSPTAANRERLAGHVGRELSIRAEASRSPEEAVADAEIVVACARSRGEQPILYGNWLREDAVVVSIGSTLPEQREIDTSVVEACDLIVCDAVDEVTHETGDMLAASQAGIAFEHKMHSLHDVMTGKTDELLSKARRPLFKSVGSALQDIVIAELAYERAVEVGLGAPMPFPLHIKRSGANR